MDLVTAAQSELNTAQIQSTAPVMRQEGLTTGATIVDAQASKIGEILGPRGDGVEVALGRARDVWGFVDIGGRTHELPATGLLTGPRRTIGMSMVELPGFEEHQARASR